MDFQDICRALYRDLMRAFPVLSRDDALAILGNLAHESGGFKSLQEKKPLVEGSAGGYGYGQWTGPRRRAYLAWCKQHGLDPASHDANAGFLIFELQTSEAAAIPKTRKAKTLYDKVVAFELGFERAGIKHYDSRFTWAQRAAKALPPQAAEIRRAPELDAMIPPPPKPLTQSKTIWAEGGKLAAIVSSVSAALAGIDWKVVLAVGGVALLSLGALTIYERVKKG